MEINRLLDFLLLIVYISRVKNQALLKFCLQMFCRQKYFPELLELTGDTGGKQVMCKHQDEIVVIETKSEELKDIDYRSDLG